jgi:threonine dehydrogenase-like Zn-dependent dehydrogenase
MGNEFGGEVAAMAARYDRRGQAGMRVTVLPVLSCGSCSRRVVGEVAQCRSVPLIGLGGSLGGFAELAVVDIVVFAIRRRGCFMTATSISTNIALVSDTEDSPADTDPIVVER